MDMSLKRVAGKANKKARNCLKCNRRLKNLKDNVVNTCETCGQRHFVDFYEDTIVLTAVERPELRRRMGESRTKRPEYEKEQAEFNKCLEEFRKKWKGETKNNE